MQALILTFTLLGAQPGTDTASSNATTPPESPPAAARSTPAPTDTTDTDNVRRGRSSFELGMGIGPFRKFNFDLDLADPLAITPGSDIYDRGHATVYPVALRIGFAPLEHLTVLAQYMQAGGDVDRDGDTGKLTPQMRIFGLFFRGYLPRTGPLTFYGSLGLEVGTVDYRSAFSQTSFGISPTRGNDTLYQAATSIGVEVLLIKSIALFADVTYSANIAREPHRNIQAFDFDGTPLFPATPESASSQLYGLGGLMLRL